ncbi:uncharacterized protein BJ171DRAFT_601408 [Polychytrium aggregatum]|uniref:uncharacterized protein n=1 Tax=Polychytrium aggregatum TaxID=110093 RepID=UPI0022FDBDE6|nr:uncharacterized protein BJ171DRAFT_601408 [Polychytrium aggregatum]KAI9201835.1 hypothetical protein BJ171DRAFT_601408 [Polychytrium aggregatum]
MSSHGLSKNEAFKFFSNLNSQDKPAAAGDQKPLHKDPQARPPAAASNAARPGPKGTAESSVTSSRHPKTPDTTEHHPEALGDAHSRPADIPVAISTPVRFDAVTAPSALPAQGESAIQLTFGPSSATQSSAVSVPAKEALPAPAPVPPPSEISVVPPSERICPRCLEHAEPLDGLAARLEQAALVLNRCSSPSNQGDVSSASYSQLLPLVERLEAVFATPSDRGLQSKDAAALEELVGRLQKASASIEALERVWGSKLAAKEEELQEARREIERLRSGGGR